MPFYKCYYAHKVPKQYQRAENFVLQNFHVLLLFCIKITLWSRGHMEIFNWFYILKFIVLKRDYACQETCSMNSFLRWPRRVIPFSQSQLFATWYPETCNKLPATIALLHVLSLWVCPCTIKVSLPSLYIYCCSCEKKYQAIHACTT